MDTMYWNSTLRLDARFGDQFHEAEARSSGLQALSVTENKITTAGILTLARFLRRNQWLLGNQIVSTHLLEIIFNTFPCFSYQLCVQHDRPRWYCTLIGRTL